MKFTLLASVVLTTVLVAGCDVSRRNAKPNQIQPSTSPSGSFVLTMPIEAQMIDPAYSGTDVWKVTISDSSGKQLYKDEASTMVANLNIYWGWDNDDRVWLYNSDDGLIWRWEKGAAGWTKIKSERADGCPDFVLPEYARK